MTERQKKLVTDNIPLVYSITSRYKNWINYEDIVAEGMLGLCSAAVAFSELRGNCFSTFAYKYIFGKCLNFINRDKIVKPKRHNGVYDNIQTITLDSTLELCFPDVFITETHVDGVLLFDTIEKKLTTDEYNIVMRMYEGYTKGEICNMLSISQKKLSTHLQAIREKLSNLKL